MATPERPLLIAPRGSREVFKIPKPRGGGPRNPKKAVQIQRLDPKFAELREALEGRRMALQSEPAGAAIEQVIVFETNGPINELFEAIAQTRGLEWLADEELRDLAQDEFFFLEEKPHKSLSAQLYLVMFSQAALEQLLSAWSLWKASKRLTAAHRVWVKVFSRLRDVRRWGVADRLRETRTIEYWETRVAEGAEVVCVELELWFRQPERRALAEAVLRAAITRAGGQVTSICLVPAIAYHAVVAKLPISAVKGMLANPEVEMLQVEDLRLVRPAGQAIVPLVEGELDDEAPPVQEALESLREPVVALLDGLPLENHRWLRGRLVAEDPEQWAETYPAHARRHGTGMASLILHGDLNQPGDALASWLYVRPILRPNGKVEQAPEGDSWVDVIHRAVRRIKEGEGGLPPSAPSVCVINLSVGDEYQPFIRSMSPLAKLLDWLAFRYRVLFVVSAGNHRRPLSIERSVLPASNPDGHQVVTAVLRDHRNRRLLSPSEAMNALTIGATPEDAAGPVTPQNDLEVHFALPPGLPSPISALGRGYRRMTKPDLLVPGGRTVFVRDKDELEQGCAAYRVDERPLRPPGHRIACPARFAGDSSATRYASGTSNAAALASRHAAVIVETLQDLTTLPQGELLSEVPMALWARTLLAHSATWQDTAASAAKDAFRALKPPQIAKQEKSLADEMTALLGFGTINVEKVLGCSTERATVLTGGEIGREERLVHYIPLPESINAHTGWRRMTITLSWFSPINPAHRKYRRAALWFDAPPQVRALSITRAGVNWQAAKRGTLQHEVFEGDRRAIDLEPNALLAIPVQCVADAGDLEERIPYAMAVTLEVAPGVNTRIYDEVRTRLAQRVKIPAST